MPPTDTVRPIRRALISVYDKTGLDELARGLADEDAAFAAELPALQTHLDASADKLRTLLLPRDEDDERDVVLEVKAGEGGAESALFAGDLARMYLRHCERRGWKSELMSESLSDLGGYKEVVIRVEGEGDKTMAHVDFGGEDGVKRLLLRYAPLEKL